MRRRVLLLWLLLGACFASRLSAQVNVTATAGTLNASYPTIAAAVTAINGGTHLGTIVVNVNAGHTETAPSGGIALTATGTLTNPITIQKNGAGSNPVITAYTGGTGTPATAVQDGIFRLVGSDYVTINGIDLAENVANADPATMEYGYALYKASATDGCQNNTIRNCVITLNRSNNTSGTAPATDGSRGIDVINGTPAAATTALIITNASGGNSYNKFYSNTIQNCNIGIALIGFADATPFANADTGNDVGGSSPASGNNILNYGGGGITSAAAGVRTLAQYNLNVSYNNIDNNNGSGVNHAAALRGIYINTAASASVAATFNTISLKGGGTTSQVTGIENASGSTAAGNTINLSNNTISGCTYGTATSGAFFGIHNSATAAVLNINNCIFSNNSTAATSGSYYLIYNAAAVTAAINMNGNQINGVTFSAASALVFRAIYNSNAGGSSAMSMSSNTLQNLNYGAACTGEFAAIYNAGAALNQVINFNTFTNLSINTTASSYIINCNNTMPASGIRTVNNNSIVGSFTKLGSGGTMYGYYANSSSTATCSETNMGNNFSNITVNGATGLTVWYSQDGSTTSPFGPSKVISNNSFSNIVGGTSAVIAFIVGYSSANHATNNISGNIISNVSAAAAVTGVNITAGNQNFFANRVDGLSSTGATSTVLGILVSSGTTQNIYKNKIYNLSGDQAGSIVYGVSVTGGITVNFYNNLIGDLRATMASSASDVVRGISISSTTASSSVNAYYNTISLNAVSAGANFNTSGIFHTVSATATTAALNLRNNIIVNNSAPAGTGLAVAYRRSGTALNNYASTSNNNLLYAGVPDTNRLIFYDGTNADQTLVLYKTRVATRDAASVTGNPTFISMSGANAGFLHLDPAVASPAESNALPISGIADDYDAVVRNATTPDIGADEGNFIAVGPIIAYTQLNNICGSGNLLLSAVNITSTAGIPIAGATVPRIYYRKGAGSWFSQAGTFSSGTTNNSNWSFTIVATDMGGLAPGDVVSYYVIAQDLSGTPVVNSNPGGVVAANVNTVTTHPGAPSTYTIVNANLSGTYTVGVGGAYTTLTAAINAYNTACLSGPVVFSLIDPAYPGETYPITIPAHPAASSTNTLTIRPATGVDATLSGSASAGALLRILNNYTTIDGSNNGSDSRNLTITNTSATTPTVLRMGSNLAGAPITNVTVQNCIVINGANTSSAIVAGDSLPGGSNPGYIRNIKIHNNLIQRAFVGIYMNGVPLTGNGAGCVVSSNDLSSTGVNAIRIVGIYAQGLDGISVTRNTIGNFESATAEVDRAIWFATGTTNGSITANIISNMTMTSTATTASLIGISVTAGLTATGIDISGNSISNFTNSGTASSHAPIFVSGTPNMTISNNTISNINQLSDISFWGIVCAGTSNSSIFRNSVSGMTTAARSTASAINVQGISRNVLIYENRVTNIKSNHIEGYGSNGITLSSGSIPANIQVYNNFISDIASYGYAGSSSIDNAYGIVVAAGSGYDISFNSVLLNTNQTLLTGLPAAMNVTSAVTTPGAVNLRNNIFANTQTVGNQRYAIYTAATRNVFSIIDNNDYFAGTAPNLGAIGGVNRATLADMQAGFGGNTNSVSADPLFTSATDLHILANPALGAKGTAIAGITTDIDNVPRKIIPDIGADEFLACDATNNISSITINTTPGSAQNCTPGVVALNVVITNNSPGAVTYAWSPSTGLSNTNSSSVTASAVGVNTYTVTVTNSIGCTATASVTVTILTPPTAGITGDLIICNGETTTITASGGIGYSWSTGATTAATNVSPAINTTYTVTVTAASGCTATTSVSVVVNSLPNASISGDLSLCPGESTTLTATSGGTGYLWSTGAVTAAINVSTNGTFTVTVTDGNGCSATSAVAVIVNQSPVVNISGATGVCSGSCTGLQATQGYVSYVWDGAETTSSIYVCPDEAEVYSVTVTDINGCTASASVLVSINTPVELSSTLVQPTTCVSMDGAINLTVTSGVGPYTYNWSTPNGAGLVNGQEDQSNLLVGLYYVTVTGSNGCSNTAVVNLFGPGGCEECPTIEVASGSPSTLCAGGTSTLTASELTDMGITYGIRFVSFPAPTADPYTGGTLLATVPNSGLTNSGTQASANVLFNTAGSQLIYAILSPAPTDPDCRPAYDFTVTVNSNPNPGISGSLTICNGQSTTLTGTGGSSYQWSTGANTQQITVSPTTNTTYAVTVTNSNSCSAVTSVVVTVNSLPTAQITGTTTICNGQSTTLTASGGTSYAWSTGAVTPAITVSPTIATTYNVTVTNGNSCSASTSVVVSVNPTPTAGITGTTTICSGQSTTLTATGGGTYLWSTGANTAAITVSPTTNTTYTVTVTNGNSCSATTSVLVTVNPRPTPGITGNAPICIGQSRTLTATGGGTYLWSTGATTAAITVSPVSNTTYTVTVTNASSCTASTSATVVVNPLPTAAITGNTNICSGGTTLLTASGGVSYSWNTGATTAAISVSPAITTTYTVTVSSAAGCSSTASRTVTVTQTPAPTITAGGPTTFCYGGSVVLSTTAVAGYTYQWSRDGVDISGATLITYTAMLGGQYRVRATNGACPGTSAPMTVSVIAPPFANILGNTQINICEGGTHTFQAQTNPIYTYQWYRNNVLIVGATNSSYAATQSGSYKIEVSNGYCSSTSNAKILHIEPFPVVTAYPQETIVTCAGAPAIVEANVSGGSMMQWFLNGNPIPGATGVFLATVYAGQYQLRVTSTLGCVAWSNIVEVEVVEVALDPVQVSSYQICPGQPAVLSMTQYPGYLYQWYKNGVWIPGALNPTLTVTSPGSYHVEVQSPEGCQGYSEIVVITEQPEPNVDIIVTELSNACKQSVFTVTATSNVPGELVWYYDGELIPTPANNTIVNAPAGIYLVTLKNACGSDEELVEVIFEKSPGIQIISEEKPILCPGDSIELIAVSGVISGFQWYKDFVAIPGATGTTHVTYEAGLYWVTANIGGCVTTSGLFKVFMNDLGDVKITAAGPTDIPEGGSVELKVTPIPFATYQWYLDGNPLAGETGMSHIATLEGDYSLIATRNGCGDKSNVITVTVQTSKPRGTISTQPLSMRYYPVPASQFVMVQSNKLGMHKLEVLGLDGRAYQELPIDFRGEAAQIDLSKLQPGMYIIRAHYGEEVIHQMLPVQR